MGVASEESVTGGDADGLLCAAVVGEIESTGDVRKGGGIDSHYRLGKTRSRILPAISRNSRTYLTPSFDASSRSMSTHRAA